MGGCTSKNSVDVVLSSNPRHQIVRAKLADISGRFEGIFRGSGDAITEVRIILSLSLSSDGCTLSGTLNNIQISNGTFNHQTLEFNFSSSSSSLALPESIDLTFQGVFDGTSLSGTVHASSLSQPVSPLGSFQASYSPLLPRSGLYSGVWRSNIEKMELPISMFLSVADGGTSLSGTLSLPSASSSASASSSSASSSPFEITSFSGASCNTDEQSITLLVELSDEIISEAIGKDLRCPPSGRYSGKYGETGSLILMLQPESIEGVDRSLLEETRILLQLVQ